MANTKQLRTRMKSVKNLQKIIKALEIVSTVKLQKLRGVIVTYREFMKSFLEVLNVVMDEINIFDFDKNKRNPNWRRLLIVVTTDKWLCWGVNSRIFKRMEKNYAQAKDNVDIFVVWRKWLEYFIRNWWNVVWSLIVSDKVLLAEINPLSAFIKKALEEKTYSKIKVYFNFFKSTMDQVLTRFKLYPLDRESFEDFLNNVWIEVEESNTTKKFLMIEPDTKTYKHDFLQLLIRTIIFSAVVNNKTTEYAARMVAMKNAKDNCNDLLVQLNLMYNKTRQLKITQEITEIVSAKWAIDA